MAGYIGSKAVSVNTTSATISDDLAVGDDLTVTDDATIGGTLGVTGVVTANAGVVVDEMTLDGDTLTATDTFTIDAATAITLDSDTGVIDFDDNGVNIGRIENSSSDFKIESRVQDKDIVFTGNDGNVGVTALTLSMSDAGTAIFGHDIKLPDNQLAKFGTDQDFEIVYDGNSRVQTTADSSGDLYITAGGAGHELYLSAADNIILRPNSTQSGIDIIGSAAVNLYYNNAKKFETTNTGTYTTGDAVYASGTLNYGGTSVPTGSNHTALFSPAGNIGLAGQFASINWPTTNGAPTTTAWWMLGRSAGADDQFSLRIRRGETAGSDQVAYIVRTTGADNAAVVDSHEFYTGASGGVKRVTVENDGDFTIEDGNLNIGTSAHGIDFAAGASGTSTSNLLDEYEEGAWNATDGSGAGLSFTITKNIYTKIGRLVYASVRLQYPTTSNTSTAKVVLPFTSTSTTSEMGGVVTEQNVDAAITITASINETTKIIFRKRGQLSYTNANLSGKLLRFGVIYTASS